MKEPSILFFISGASGSGKTAVLPALRQLLPDMYIDDFDYYPQREQIGPLDSTEQRQRVTELWLQTALARGSQPTVVSGVGVLGEVLASPSAIYLDHIAFCLLDCDDVERLNRIRQRGDVQLASMDMLCWSAWLRVHHVDPQFRQDVITTGKNPEMVWSRWTSWEPGHPSWRCQFLNTTTLSIQEVAESITQWIRKEQDLYAKGQRLVWS